MPAAAAGAACGARAARLGRVARVVAARRAGAVAVGRARCCGASTVTGGRVEDCAKAPVGTDRARQLTAPRHSALMVRCWIDNPMVGLVVMLQAPELTGSPVKFASFGSIPGDRGVQANAVRIGIIRPARRELLLKYRACMCLAAIDLGRSVSLAIDCATATIPNPIGVDGSPRSSRCNSFA